MSFREYLRASSTLSPSFDSCKWFISTRLRSPPQSPVHGRVTPAFASTGICRPMPSRICPLISSRERPRSRFCKWFRSNGLRFQEIIFFWLGCIMRFARSDISDNPLIECTPPNGAIGFFGPPVCSAPPPPPPSPSPLPAQILSDRKSGGACVRGAYILNAELGQGAC